MKNLLLTTLLFICLSGFSQTSVKLNLTNIAVGLFDVQVEHAVSDKHAFQLGIGYMPKRDILIKSVLAEAEKEQLESYEESLFDGIDFNGFRITPEFKLYTGDDGAKGFYIDFWAKYAVYSLVNPSYSQEYENLLGATKSADFNFDASITNISAGLGLGTQWFIKDLISLDILWLGIGYNYSVMSAEYASEAVDINWDKWQEDATGFNDYGEIEFSKIDNGLKAEFKPLIPIALRSSISLGVKF
jgi:hypothetical protein